ncbi:MAG: class I mannose-6-phosphate isomerase [Bacteroidaceae bacterium]|nr:class I mannose-6-phosphate isomerase [Bacteroidaceae bacterium]
MLYPLLFEANLFPIIWGGNRLIALKGMPPIDVPIGESWEISAVKGKESIVANGPLKGKNLRDLSWEYGSELLGRTIDERYGSEFPILVKFIDTSNDLSIQVHPDDSMAMRRHGCMGKTEMWYVVDALPDAYLYAGFSRDITREEYRRMVEDDSICDVLAKHNISKGDAFYVPAGIVHALCRGTFVVEIQQSSDITYRIYDYKRIGMDGKPRELHTSLAEDVLDFSCHKEYSLDYTATENTSNVICNNRFFRIGLLPLTMPMRRDLRHYDSFIVYVCIQGECIIGESTYLQQGFSCLVPAVCADIFISPAQEGAKVELLEIYLDNEDFNE